MDSHVAPVNIITLNSLDDSTISKLSLYTDRAQLTRVFKFNVLGGQNKVTITSLPNVLDHDSLRVEGHGQATIQGVTSHKAEIEEAPISSPLLLELTAKQEKVMNALARAKKALTAIDTYIDKLDVKNLNISKLGEAMEVYDATEERWDDKVLELESKRKTLDEQIAKERGKLVNQVMNKKLRVAVVIGLFAQQEAEVSLNLIYAVSKAKWEAAYDVRVNTRQIHEPATVVYKANITQETGEDWKDAPITLETTKPTFGITVPVLATWNISLFAPYRDINFCRSQSDALKNLISQEYGLIEEPQADLEEEEEEDTYMTKEETVITSKGHFNATFRVPGTTTIPSSEEERSVTIVSLELEAKMSWVCIPKGDVRVHLRATIKNSSEYTFLPGNSNVYVDQSFVARSSIASVSPQETFICPLGLDPSIRVAYHEVTKHISSSGFYNKSRVHSFSQRISIHNTKSIPIDDLKLTDHIPVSQNANLIVNLISPALTIPVPSSTLYSKITPNKVQVSNNVVAQWHGADDPSVGVDSLGKDGRVDWVCQLPAFGKMNLLLQWDVSAGETKQIFGL